jgi:hypothetical protein
LIRAFGLGLLSNAPTEYALNEGNRQIACDLSGDGVTYTLHCRIGEDFENELEAPGSTSNKINLETMGTGLVKFAMPDLAFAQIVGHHE